MFQRSAGLAPLGSLAPGCRDKCRGSAGTGSSVGPSAHRGAQRCDKCSHLSGCWPVFLATILQTVASLSLPVRFCLQVKSYRPTPPHPGSRFHGMWFPRGYSSVWSNRGQSAPPRKRFICSQTSFSVSLLCPPSSVSTAPHTQRFTGSCCPPGEQPRPAGGGGAGPGCSCCPGGAAPSSCACPRPVAARRDMSLVAEAFVTQLAGEGRGRAGDGPESRGRAGQPPQTGLGPAPLRVRRRVAAWGLRRSRGCPAVVRRRTLAASVPWVISEDGAGARGGCGG